MKIYGEPSEARLAVIGSQHGNEPFGRDVIERLVGEYGDDPRLGMIVANEEALAVEAQFIDEDLNRTYPGDPDGNHEQRLAHRISSLLRETPLVLDLHTTVSDVNVFPIIVRFRPEEQRLINATDYTEIAFMDLEHGGTNSGLGNFPGGGIALEFGNRYVGESFDQAYAEVRDVVTNALAETERPPQRRVIYHITRLAPWIPPEELELEHFGYSEELGGHAVLPDAPGYHGQHRGFVATDAITVEV